MQQSGSLKHKFEACLARRRLLDERELASKRRDVIRRSRGVAIDRDDGLDGH